MMPAGRYFACTLPSGIVLWDTAFNPLSFLAGLGFPHACDCWEVSREAYEARERAILARQPRPTAAQVAAMLQATGRRVAAIDAEGRLTELTDGARPQ